MDRDSIKKDSFKRLANKRVNRLLNDIRLLGNLSNPQNYSYTDKDIKIIFKAIDGEISLAKSRFNVALSRRSVIRIK